MNDTQAVTDGLTLARERVRAGWEWLHSDQARELGFNPSHISPELVRTASPFYCPLGQSVGGEGLSAWLTGVNLLEAAGMLDDDTDDDPSWTQRHGFVAQWDVPVTWEHLDQAWQEVLSARVAEAA
jgi:hypothetical protein